MRAKPANRRSARAALALAALAVAAAASPAASALMAPGTPAATRAAAPAAARTWPPRPSSGLLFVHFGEEHLTDDDGPVVFPKVVEESIRWKPDVVLASGDKSDDGTTEKLTAYRKAIEPFARAGIPWFGAVGNHDRQSPPGVPGGTSPVGASLEPYEQVFAPFPYPLGDAAPLTDPRFGPRTRPASDPDGASSHYYLDVGEVRVIFIDNSCQSITNCGGTTQNPPMPDGDAADQYEFLAKRAAEARAAGRHVWVVMHQPTQDPRDQSHAATISLNHNMGKGSSPDNALFEQRAAEAGVELVMLGHIKGQWEYRGQGGVRYFIDGGAGGRLYTSDPKKWIGVDTGYWYGYRLINVDGKTVTTDVVPLLTKITVKGPATLRPGEFATFSATGRQPAEKGVRVDALELRDPDRTVSDGAALPNPARIWTTSNPRVLRPIAARSEDPRRDPRTQTVGGTFAADCPGRAYVSVTSGFLTEGLVTTVPSRPGKILQRIARRARGAERGRRARLAVVDLAQPAQVRARVLRGGRTVATLRDECLRATDPAGLDWKPGRGARTGRYVLDVRVRSDRKSITRRLAFTLR